MGSPELEAKIKQLIAADEIEAAIELLLIHFQNSKQLDDIVLLSGSYNALKKEVAKGTIGSIEVQKTLNKLRANIVDFITKQAKVAPFATQSIENQYRLSLVRISILWVLYQEKHESPSLNITKIQALSQLKNRKHIADAIYEMEKYNLVRKEKVETIICWSLTEKGVALAQEFENSLLFKLEGK